MECGLKIYKLVPIYLILLLEENTAHQHDIEPTLISAVEKYGY